MTGGIGAGKSEALRAFGRHGAATLSSDDIVHRLLREDRTVYRVIVERLGEAVLDEAGQIDRTAVGRIVFSDPEALRWLEELLHPLVVAEYLAWRESLGRLEHPPALCVTEVPLLYEVGGEDRFDYVVVITAPDAVRASRSRVPPTDREGRLIPDEEKARRADATYVNHGTRADLEAFVAGLVRKLEGSR